MLKRLSLSVSVVLLLALTLVGCSKSAGPEQVAQSFFNALTSADWETANTLRSPSMDSSFTEPSPEDARVVNALVAKMSFEVGKATVEGEQAQVPFDMTMPDLEKLVTKFMSELLALSLTLPQDTTEEQLNTILQDKFVELLNAPELEYVTFEGTMRLQQEEGAWKVLALDGVEDFTDSDLLE
jgi:hypothetical protein